MFTKTYKRRRRIRAWILGFAVVAAAATVLPVAGAVTLGPPPQHDALAAEQPAQIVALPTEKFVETRPVPLAVEKFVEPTPAPLPVEKFVGTEGTPVSEPTTPSVRRFPGDLVADSPGSTSSGDVAIGAAIIACLLLSAGVAILVSRRREGDVATA